MKIIVDNLATEYLDEGAGKVLVLLHGWGLTLHHYDALCAAVRGVRVVRLDLPGFGGSEEPPRAWTVSDYAAYVAHFCEKLGVVPDVLVGHSFGGRIITKGLGTDTLSARKAVLIASAGVARRRTLRNTFYAALAKMGRLMLLPLPHSVYERFRAALYRRTKSDYLNMRSMKETFLNMIREDLSEYAKRVTVPTLLIWGELDEVTPLTEGARLHGLISGSRLEVIPDTGHFVYRERPQEVAALITTFI